MGTLFRQNLGELLIIWRFGLISPTVLSASLFPLWLWFGTSFPWSWQTYSFNLWSLRCFVLGLLIWYKLTCLSRMRHTFFMAPCLCWLIFYHTFGENIIGISSFFQVRSFILKVGQVFWYVDEAFALVLLCWSPGEGLNCGNRFSFALGKGTVPFDSELCWSYGLNKCFHSARPLFGEQIDLSIIWLNTLPFFLHEATEDLLFPWQIRAFWKLIEDVVWSLILLKSRALGDAGGTGYLIGGERHEGFGMAWLFRESHE